MYKIFTIDIIKIITINMMKSQEPGLKAQGASLEKSGEADLKAMMRDPKYWKEKDPQFIAKVTEGFKKMYG